MLQHQYIVIVDDEYDVQEILKFNLKREGFEVDTFSNPVKAIKHIKTKKPHLIVTDWLMPEMDGIEFCRTIKSDRKTSDIPVVMITCKGEKQDMVLAHNAGVEDYFVKPFRISELIEKTRKILNAGTA